PHGVDLRLDLGRRRRGQRRRTGREHDQHRGQCGKQGEGEDPPGRGGHVGGCHGWRLHSSRNRLPGELTGSGGEYRPTAGPGLRIHPEETCGSPARDGATRRRPTAVPWGKVTFNDRAVPRLTTIV